MSELSQKQKLKMLRDERHKNGLCTKCGKPLDCDGRMCSACKQIAYDYQTKRREFLKSLGLCTICGRNEVFEHECSCPECKAKIAERDQKRIKEKAERNKEVYNERKKQGVCPRCGNPKEEDGYSWCKDCRAKRTKWNKRKGKKNVRSEWSSQGYCVTCGNPETLPNKKLCADCYRAILAGNKKMLENRPEGYNDTWKKTNMKMRGRFRRIPDA